MNKKAGLCLLSLVMLLLLTAQNAQAVDMTIVEFSSANDEDAQLIAQSEQAAQAPPSLTFNAESAIKVQPQGEGDYLELKKKYDQLLIEKETVETDRDNILAQMREAAKKSTNYLQMKDAYEDLLDEKKLLRDEKNRLILENSDYLTKVAILENEAEQLKEDLREARILTNTSAQLDKIKELEEKIAFSQKTKEDLVDIMKELERQINSSQDKEKNLAEALNDKDNEIQRLTIKLDSLESDYKNLNSDNSYLKNKVAKIPKEFASLARENKKLTRQTADMHYNLGVFYTQHKEYKRAILEFIKALDIRPDDASAHYNLGYVYAEHVIDQHKAVEHFKEYLRISKGKDKDADRAKKYILIWDTYNQDEIQ